MSVAQTLRKREFNDSVGASSSIETEIAKRNQENRSLIMWRSRRQKDVGGLRVSTEQRA